MTSLYSCMWFLFDGLLCGFLRSDSTHWVVSPTPKWSQLFDSMSCHLAVCVVFVGAAAFSCCNIVAFMLGIDLLTPTVDSTCIYYFYDTLSGLLLLDASSVGPLLPDSVPMVLTSSWYYPIHWFPHGKTSLHCFIKRSFVEKRNASKRVIAT